MPLDPRKKLTSLRAICKIDIFIAFISLFFHTWTFVWILKDPNRLQSTSQPSAVVYTGITTMIIFNMTSIALSWMVLTQAEQVLTHSTEVLLINQRWKLWTTLSVLFFITALLVLVFTSGKQIHQGAIQYYMAFLLFLISFSVVGIYYVRKFINAIICWNNYIIGIDSSDILSNNFSHI